VDFLCEANDTVLREDTSCICITVARGGHLIGRLVQLGS